MTHITCSCSSDDCRQNGCKLARDAQRVLEPNRGITFGPISEPTDSMIDAAHAVLSDPPYLKGDRRNTRNALRAALAAMSGNQ